MLLSVGRHQVLRQLYPLPVTITAVRLFVSRKTARFSRETWKLFLKICSKETYHLHGRCSTDVCKLPFHVTSYPANGISQGPNSIISVLAAQACILVNS